MRLTFQYNPDDGRITSYSEGKNEMPEKFLQLELEVTQEEYEKMRQNYLLFIRDGKLVCEKPQRIMDEEEIQRKEKVKANLKEKLQDPKVQLKDISNLLLELFS